MEEEKTTLHRQGSDIGAELDRRMKVVSNLRNEMEKIDDRTKVMSLDKYKVT